MSKFKVGDMIAVYSSSSKYILKLSSILDDGLFHFSQKDNPGHLNYIFHPKQCRRLKTKIKAQECEVFGFCNRDGSFALLVNPAIRIYKGMKLREVMKK